MGKTLRDSKGRYAGSLKGHNAPTAAREPGWFTRKFHAWSDKRNQANVQDRIESIAADLRVDAAAVRGALEAWSTPSRGTYEDPTYLPDEYAYTPRQLGLPETDINKRASRRLGYEHYLAQPRPVFVYGTLRTGQRAEHAMDIVSTNRSAARMDGVNLYGDDHQFPFALESSDGGYAIGELVWRDTNIPDPEIHEHLDQYEGFNSDHPSRSLYERVERTVVYTDATGEQRSTTAWVYLSRGSARAALHGDTPIEGGDWVKARARYLQRNRGH